MVKRISWLGVFVVLLLGACSPAAAVQEVAPAEAAGPVVEVFRVPT